MLIVDHAFSWNLERLSAIFKNQFRLRNAPAADKLPRLRRSLLISFRATRVDPGGDLAAFSSSLKRASLTK